MVFDISRVSCCGSDKNDPPCKNAYAVDYFREIHQGWVRDEKGNLLHQVKYIPDKKWRINISTLEELIELYKEVGEELIINDESIKIYDDYIE